MFDRRINIRNLKHICMHVGLPTNTICFCITNIILFNASISSIRDLSLDKN